MKLGMLAVLFSLPFLGCKPPKYSYYTSPARDFQCRVPWGWEVMYDKEGKTFSNVAFIGPFEPEFYLGAPSFSVRWYSRFAAHRLRDGSLEMYGGADDFIKQALGSLYRRDRQMDQAVTERKDIVAGRTVKYFVVESPAPVPHKARWGTALDSRTGQAVNPRKHAYVVVPMPSGFYVLAYPATWQAYDKYKDQFAELARTFIPLKDGPGGASLPPAAPVRKPVR